MKGRYGGAVHLIEAAAPGMVRIVCDSTVLPQFSPRYWGMPDDTELTCRDCKAAEKRAAKERGETG